ncbi:MAG TPA: hypothetical protein VF926_04445, partial [Mycobacterium sp.]
KQKDVAGSLRAQQLLLDQLGANQSVDRALLEARMRAAGVATADHEYACVAVDPGRVESAAKVVDARSFAKWGMGFSVWSVERCARCWPDRPTRRRRIWHTSSGWPRATHCRSKPGCA